MVPEGDSLSQSRHVCKETYLPMCQSSRVCRAGPPTDGLPSKVPTCQQGSQDIYQETQKGGVPRFPGVTEAGSRPLMRQPSSTHQRAAPCHAGLPWHQPPGALPAGRRTSPALLSAWLRRSFLIGRWRLPCPPPCCLPDLQTETLGLGFTIPHGLLCVRVCVLCSLRLSECE